MTSSACIVDDGDVGANFPDPLWVLSEEELEGMEFLRYALDVIKTIDTNDNFHATESLF